MIESIKRSGRWPMVLIIASMGVLSVSMLVFRIWFTHSLGGLFLVWNLFLASLPYVLTTWLMTKKRRQEKRWILYPVIMAWLLFFPNSPYILTDLFHMERLAFAPVWFNMVLILAFAWTGLMMGFLSLMDIRRVLSSRIGYRWSAVAVSGMLVLSAFGIYLGRFLRWNSWDVVSNPSGLLYDIGERVAYPMDHPSTWGVTIFMGILLNMMFWGLIAVKDMHTQSKLISKGGRG